MVFTHISMCMYLQFTNNELCRIPHEVLSKETLMEWDQIMSEYPQQLQSMNHLSLPAVHYIEAHQQWDFSLRWTCLQ